MGSGQLDMEIVDIEAQSLVQYHQQMMQPHITVEIAAWCAAPFKMCCPSSMTGESLRRSTAEHLGYPADHISLHNIGRSADFARRSLESQQLLQDGMRPQLMEKITLTEQGLADGDVICVRLAKDSDSTCQRQEMGLQRQKQFLTYGPPAGPPDCPHTTPLPLVLYYPTVSAPLMKTGRKNCKWSHKETWALLFGMERYGPGRWKKILVDPEFSYHLRARTYVHLKDKWGNLYRTFRTGRVPRGDTALFLPKVREILLKWSESF